MSEELALFCDRFPRYALLAPSWEPALKKPLNFSDWFANISLEDVEVVYLLGLANEAYPYFAKWLKKDPERQLIILEENEGIIRAALSDKALWVHDRQVDFFHLSEKGRRRSSFFKDLAERYPAKKVEVLCLPDYNKAKWQRAKLSIFRKTALAYSLFVDRLHGFQHFENFAANLSRLEGGFYANKFEGSFGDLPAIVCGAGPSLQKVIPLLKKLEGRAVVIAGGSTLAAMSAQGYEPHFGIAVDPNFEEFERFQKSFCFESPLLFSTRIFPGVFKTCNGPFGYLRAGIGGAPELWLEEELSLTEPLLGKHIGDEAISVTSICLAFAQHIGAKTILLSGVDLAYTDGKRYADGVMEQQASVSTDQRKNVPDQILKRKDKQGRSVYTAVRWVMEAASIAQFAKRHSEIEWINTTEGGLPIAGLQNLSLEKVFEKRFHKTSDIRGKVHQQIALHPLPKVPNLLAGLKKSIEQCIAHLEILTGTAKGSSVLAELDIQEELAASILFYDIKKTIAQALERKMRKEDSLKEKAHWELYLKVARKYLLVLNKNF